MKAIPTQEHVVDILNYDPDTGAFTWNDKSKNPHPKRVGVAGYNHIKGYRTLYIMGREYLAHRVAWLYMYGVWPKDQIDHINHIKNDNRIENLREASNAENHRNMPLQKRSVSGVVGVSWSTACNKWRARVKVDDKEIHLGVYASIFDAVCARKSAENKIGYHPNHGEAQKHQKAEKP